MSWTPTLGAWLDNTGSHFRVWAPRCQKVWAHPANQTGASRRLLLTAAGDGYFEGTCQELGEGDKYWYELDDEGCFPDPTSRYQPDGVHGPSQIIDLHRFSWNDLEWRGPNPKKLIFYELHIGTFTQEGTFGAAERRLPYLSELGVTAIEIMPVSDFPGQRNWGYDGVALFAPARCYGHPRDFQQFVNRAHQLGLAVLLDVVYNHLGPDGNYLGVYAPHYFSSEHSSPWGASLNFDGAFSEHVRRYFLENALYWIHEFHLDGLRLDATHAIHDSSPEHFLLQLSSRVRESMEQTSRRAFLFAEDNRNLARLGIPRTKGGFGLDGIWADDFHHQMRRLLTGEKDGYFQDYSGTARELVKTIAQGWTFTGQYSSYHGGLRGTDPSLLKKSQLVFCLQNHDQVGNRAFGERLHHQIGLAEYRAASALLLLAPENPLLFMGQEWATSSPFLYFTDHSVGLGQLVTEGRRREFQKFKAFSDPQKRELIPDPQDPDTFRKSCLHWEEVDREPHLWIFRLYRDLIRFRKHIYYRNDGSRLDLQLEVIGRNSLLLYWEPTVIHPALLCLIHLKGGGTVRLESAGIGKKLDLADSTILFSTEDSSYLDQADPPQIDTTRKAIFFPRPGALLLKLAMGQANLVGNCL
jgi:maltooligosyltrehalose trehalohydrolase